MPIYKDQLHRETDIPHLPKRIISLVPSQTELLADLGLDEEVTGITKFCVHPVEWFRNKTRVGGTKTVNIDLIRTLQPDLIIANKEENVQEQVEALVSIAPVWVSDIDTVEQALQMIDCIGEITGKIPQSISLANRIRKDFESIREARPVLPLRTAYLIWKDPYMAAGGDTFISDVMRVSGFENVFADQPRYPAVTPALLQEKNTQLVLLSTEPYPFRQKHIDTLQAQLPGVKILLVDGEIFSWYGSRMQYAKNYIIGLWEELKQD